MINIISIAGGEYFVSLSKIYLFNKNDDYYVLFYENNKEIKVSKNVYNELKERLRYE